ncbi:MAG: hypothetical protein WC655_21105 [Candidatus Hydrogenedentales bacterium]|jgi:ribosomal protein L11 methylase PrmA
MRDGEMPGAVNPASFRDPGGFVFRGGDGILYRQINTGAADDYRRLMDSGLYADLTGAGLLIEHDEAPLTTRRSEAGEIVIRPRELPFISYPYEWSFAQLKEAALLTLRVQERALHFNMCLKDASAYNIAFKGTRPVFIDTLSFEPYAEGAPWVAYRQFCQHFLAPLALAAYREPRMSNLLQVHLDGIPLELASQLLPRRTWLRFGLLMHIHLLASMQRREARRQKQRTPLDTSALQKRSVTKTALRGMLDSLRGTVEHLMYRRRVTEWSDYYANNSYSDEGVECKKRLTSAYLERTKPRVVWDLGANTGQYSRIAARMGAYTVAFDMDWRCVEINFQESRTTQLDNVLPLCMDLTNPSPAIGWAHRERSSLQDRGPADTILALALVHHIAIGNNVPLGRIAEYFAKLCRHLVIEFVPKDDVQTQRLLESREDIFTGYTRERFEAEFGVFFRILEANAIAGSDRVLYLMESVAN